MERPFVLKRVKSLDGCDGHMDKQKDSLLAIRNVANQEGSDGRADGRVGAAERVFILVSRTWTAVTCDGRTQGRSRRKSIYLFY